MPGGVVCLELVESTVNVTDDCVAVATESLEWDIISNLMNCFALENKFLSTGLMPLDSCSMCESRHNYLSE